jgi:hypothetical protein
MTRKLIILGALFALIGGLAVAQELKVEYQFNVANAADPGNYFSFIGPIRYMSALKDKVDATTGASKLNSTENFNAYRYDVKGKLTLPEALRGLFLYPCAPHDQAKVDDLTVSKASDGAITIHFAHRGTAYELVTDRSGKLTFPEAAGRKRAIGYIQGEGPQVISRDFSGNGKADGIDWRKVWNPGIAGGKEITAGVNARTGNIVADGADPASMFYWQGSLQLTFEGNILKVVGGMNSVKR